MVNYYRCNETLDVMIRTATNTDENPRRSGYRRGFRLAITGWLVRLAGRQGVDNECYLLYKLVVNIASDNARNHTDDKRRNDSRHN